MKSKAKFLGHPIHQMLIPLPIGLLAGSLGFDIVGILGGSPGMRTVAWYLIGAGVITGLVAAVFGAIDFSGIPRKTRAWRVGALHGLGNVAMIALFAVGWILRRPSPDAPGPLPMILSIVAIGLILVTGWLGGELVDRLGVGVDDGANLDAPSSLSRRDADDLPPPRV